MKLFISLLVQRNEPKKHADCISYANNRLRFREGRKTTASRSYLCTPLFRKRFRLF